MIVQFFSFSCSHVTTHNPTPLLYIIRSNALYHREQYSVPSGAVLRRIERRAP